jgi:hypothetical protein
MRRDNWLIALAIGVVVAMLACTPDEPSGSVSSGAKPANVWSYEYLCGLGYPGYEAYCEDFGGLAAADTIWKMHTRFLAALQNQSDSFYSLYLSRGYSHLYDQWTATTYYDPNDCHAYYTDAKAMWDQGMAQVGYFDNSTFLFNNSYTLDAVTDWSTGQWAFAEQRFAYDYIQAGSNWNSNAIGMIMGDAMLHEVIHDVDNVGNGEDEELYVDSRVAACTVSWQNLRAGPQVRRNAGTRKMRNRP